jgi:hypothetical protein
MGERKINIPGTIDEAVASLTGIGALLIAKEWERAAIVAAFVTLSEGKGKRNARTSISPVEFAALGVVGFKSKDTVRAYAQAWQEAINQGKAVAAEPGATVALPDLTWESRKAIEATPEPEPTAQPEPTTRPTPTITSRPTGPRVTPDPVTGRVYTDDLPHHDTDAEVAEWRKRNPGRATPIDNYTPAKAIEDWLDTLQRVCRSMVKFTDDKESLRNRIHADVDGIFDETQS